MAFAIAAEQPPPRAAELAWDDVGPGLYADETALELDDGTIVAVSVEPKWLANGGGVSFTAWARWIEADGTAKLSPHEDWIETTLTHHADPFTVERLGVAGVAKELLLAVLGEPATMRDVDGQAVAELPLSADIRRNVSIRTALRSVADTGPAAIDAGAVLVPPPDP